MTVHHPIHSPAPRRAHHRPGRPQRRRSPQSPADAVRLPHQRADRRHRLRARPGGRRIPRPRPHRAQLGNPAQPDPDPTRAPQAPRAHPRPRGHQRMTVPAVTLTPRTEPGLGAGATAGTLLQAASRDDFHRWEQQLASTGHCAHPIRLAGRIDAIDRATGQTAPIYDTAAEPGGVLLTGCGNRREAVCPGCSEVYKGDARQIIRTGLTGGKGMPDTVTGHPCVFVTLTAPSFGPVHTTRTARNGRTLACRPRRDAHHRRCPHGSDVSCPRHHQPGDPRLGQALCPDCYDYTGHVLFNALGPELWRRFTIYLPRQMARLLGITQKALRSQVTVRFVKVAEYQARGIVHYHAVIRLDAPGDTYQPPPLRYDTALLTAAIQATAAAISCDTVVLLARMLWRAAGANPVDSLPVIDPGLGRILRFGTQIDTLRYPPRPWRAAGHWDSAVSTGGRELHRQIRHQDHRRARTPPPAPFGSRCHRRAPACARCRRPRP